YALGEQVLRYFSLEKVLCPPKADCDFSASISTKISCQEPQFIHPAFLILFLSTKPTEINDMAKLIELNLETNTTLIVDYLSAIEILKTPPTSVAIEKPGEGNMNAVLRFKYDKQSLILKQSKSFVNKFPSIPAPRERIHTEAQFYQYAGQISGLSEKMPNLRYFDPQQHIIILEDLGEGSDFSYLYQPLQTLSDGDIKDLLVYLASLHGQIWSEEALQAFPNNLALRKLNHQHIFFLPFQADNGFDLDSIQAGLAALAQSYIADEELKAEIEQLGEKYLSQAHQLLHGDYYPGSWIRSTKGLKIIDPEFAFMGHTEFELGVLIAHLLLSGHQANWIESKLDAHYPLLYDEKESRQYAGVEIMRRLIGIAQLPLQMELEEKAAMLRLARKMVLADN
ncbi:MAG: phosphotransferase, partial [Bacteroidota bacterium]